MTTNDPHAKEVDMIDILPGDVVRIREPGSAPVNATVVGYWRSNNWQVRDEKSQTTFMAQAPHMRLWFRA